MYTTLLILAIASVLLGGVAHGLSFVDQIAYDRVRRWALLGRGCGLLALVVALAAALSHFALGHGSGSEAPMRFLSFLREHPIVILLVLSGLGLAAIRRGGRDRRT